MAQLDGGDALPARQESRRFLGLEFAPLFIPVERRLQTAALVGYGCMFTVIPLVLLILFLALLYTPLMWIPLAYATWTFYDIFITNPSTHGGRSRNWMRNLSLWKYYADYFPAHLVKTADLVPSRNYLIGYHPHGVIGCGAMASFGSEALGFSKLFPGIKPHLLTLKMNFYIPFVRNFLLWEGICDVSKASIQWILTKQGKGNAAIIVVGGAEEALEAHPGRYNLTLGNRKGFAKMAIKTGASLVPVFAFGENDLFFQVDNPHGSTLRTWQEKFKQTFGISPLLIHGRGVFNYSFGLLPFRKPIHVIVGPPIHVAQCSQPSPEQVDDIHQRYIQQLSTLFDEHKTKYGVDLDKKLHFV